MDYDPTANYNMGHVPGAVLLDWRKDLNDPITRDLLSKDQLEQLLGNAGATKQTTFVLYGDFNNWFAAFAYWILKYYGVEKIVLMNGGRKKWLAEDREVTKEIPNYPKTTFKTTGRNERIRTYMDYVKSS